MGGGSAGTALALGGATAKLSRLAAGSRASQSSKSTMRNSVSVMRSRFTEDASISRKSPSHGLRRCNIQSATGVRRWRGQHVFESFATDFADLHRDGLPLHVFPQRPD